MTVALAVVALAAVLPSAALAALQPGTPLAVAPGVPDQGRAWEVVTPLDTVAAIPYNIVDLSPDGNGLFYITMGRLPGATSPDPPTTPNLATRGPSGWTNTPVTSPYPELAMLPFSIVYRGPEALSPDFSSSVWLNPLPLQPGETQKGMGLFRKGPDGGFDLLADIGSGEDPYANTSADGASFIGASTDTQHVVFVAAKHLLAADATRSEGLSVYEADGEILRLVDVGDDGALLSDCGSTVPTRDAISRDGRRIFFLTHPSCSGTARLFLREDGATTTEISASQCDLADCGPEANVFFAGATPDGSSAFLITAQRLTDDDANGRSDLYRYDVASGELTLLSSGTVEAVKEQRVLASTDGSHVYFYSGGYNDPGGAVLKTAYLADASSLRWIPALDKAGPYTQISPSGRYAVFSTYKGVAKGDTDGRPDIYRYDAEAGTTTWISTGPAGGNGPFDTDTEPTFQSEQAIDGFVRNIRMHPFRRMSEDGSRIFFATAEQLVPEDHNELLDVYEWANGSLGLVSAGAEGVPADYLGSTPDGRTAFLRTTATLVAEDRDGGYEDYYAARIGGGFPGIPAAECDGSPCRPGPGQKAARERPASADARNGGIVLRRLGAGERRHIAATGWIELLAEVPGPGDLSAAARAMIGRRMLTVASTEVRVAAAGPVRVRMRLSKVAREAIAKGEELRVHAILRLKGQKRTTAFELGGTR